MRALAPRTVLFFLCLFHGISSLAGELPTGFVDITDIIPGIELDMRYHSDANFVGRRIDGYEAPRCIISEKAAVALRAVQAELNNRGLGLKIYDAYRPQRAVDHFVRWAQDLGDTRLKETYYPGVAKKDLFKDGYIAEKSGHSRGSTVDLTIVMEGELPQELDMGTAWDFFGLQSWPASTEVTPAQKTNRMLLQGIMVKHGFRPLEQEWWHFTLEDEPFPDQYFDFVIK